MYSGKNLSLSINSECQAVAKDCVGPEIASNYFKTLYQATPHIQDIMNCHRCCLQRDLDVLLLDQDYTLATVPYSPLLSHVNEL